MSPVHRYRLPTVCRYVEFRIPFTNTEVTVMPHIENVMQKKPEKMEKSYVKKNLSFWIPAKRNKVQGVTIVNPFKTVVTFQEALRAIFVTGQFFALMPVDGIMSNNPRDVKYKRFSWKLAYTLVSLTGQFFMTAMCLYSAIYSDTSLKGTTSVIFYGTTIITMVMFIQIAKRLPNLVQMVHKTELLDPNYDSRLAITCNITCALVLSMALFEHILSLIAAFSGAMVCYPHLNLYESFVRHFYPWVFRFLPYSAVLGLFTQFIHFQSTFVWNYSDLFVICMSYYLTSRLQRVNKKLLAAQSKYLPESFWRSSREEYGRATQLVRKVDDVISGVIFISFANNLFYICLQLFNTLEDGINGTGVCSSRSKGYSSKLSHTHILGGYEDSAYFVFSLVFLISRSVAVSLIASQVNSASTVPATVLYDVPSPVYCVEVQRFLDQVTGDKVTLTGLQFFSVTRSLLLTVAGTIVTYELVMFQFKSSDSTVQLNNTTTTAVTDFIPTTTAT